MKCLAKLSLAEEVAIVYIRNGETKTTTANL